MGIEVTVDKPLECCGVHWASPYLAEAQKQFEDWGFAGITGFHKAEDAINGNTARDRVKEIARRQDIKWFYVGDHDYTVGNNAAIYRFSYEEYTGDPSGGNSTDDKNKASYTPE